MYQCLIIINHVLISQQHEPGAGDHYFPYEMQQYPPQWIYPGLPSPYEEIPAHLRQPRLLRLFAGIPSIQRRQFNAGINPNFFAPYIFVSRAQEG